AAVALVLAAVGLYGVVSYSVSQRTQEIGLRMAIGAQRRDVLRLVVGAGMKLAMIGAVIGISSALALSKVAATMLFELTPLDPVSYSGTAAVLLAVIAVVIAVVLPFPWVRNPQFDRTLAVFSFASLLYGNSVEELIFRGYAFERLIAAIGHWKAQLVTAILFAVFHIANGWPW